MIEALRKTTSALFDPDRRFRQARIFHATRVALALLVSIALTTGIDVPHGEWATITVLVVIGGLQHHGNIRRRAAERGAGTVIGALIGLFLIIQETYFGIPMLTWGLMAVICGYCAYHAVGKGGYIALLAAVTVVITAGHGEQNVYDALWRTVDVLIGTAIALVFSFAFPAYASYSWRFKLAALLRGCAAVHAKIERGERDEKARQQDMMKLSNLLVQMRSLIPSVAKETSVPAADLEEVQHSARVSISALEMLAAIDPDASEADGNERYIRDLLLEMAAALEAADIALVRQHAALPTPHPDDPTIGQSSHAFLTLQLSAELAHLHDHLSRMAAQTRFPYSAR
ncbi:MULTISPECIES: FUSC family protein [Cupriavidus]|uniref:FUSC family protein n=1 Tax=Cupriavidus pauculus TaxID=82633 RepID=A0A3G8H9N1_9BURK|nr:MULTISPECIES: FUSC family protein [Cupriavidus]AZG16252.1 FUSC family protein [Cupriavidus pauculus]MDT6964622.1 FUSC family protein [Cupriavidus sp. SZY C1]